MIGQLPQTLTVEGIEYPIRSDYRNVLQVFEAFSDPELEMWQKWTVAVYLIFQEFSCIEEVEQAILNGFQMEEACKQLAWFISADSAEKAKTEQPVYDWIKDEQIIFSAVNKVAGVETRAVPYIHWWTFLGYFSEVGESTFSFIVGIRNKLNRGTKLEKTEREFYNSNRDIVKLEPSKSKEELRKEQENKALLREVLG